MTTRESARSTQGMVTSPHSVATQCGLEVLAQGGNAVEAAIATAAALCVTYPHFSGLGGDAFFVIANASGQVQTISGIGQAASDTAGYGGSIPVRGPRSMLTTAGLVDALGCAFDHSRNQLGGSVSWQGLLSSAVALARDGYPISPSERYWLEFRMPEAVALNDVFTAFCKDGVLPEPGAIRKQPQLARTLETLAERGARDMYEGALASALAEGLAQAGSALTLNDLAQTRARIESPLSVPYRGGTLMAHRPPTQGVTTLQIMGILERFDLSQVEEGSADYYHLLVEAVKQAFIDRDRLVADPDFQAVPTAEMLSPDYLSRMAAAVQRDQALPWPHAFKTGDTVFVGAADTAGNAVSLLATVYFDWGSGVMVGDSGVIWHNRGASFSLDPTHPNCLAPGKRPFHTLNPGVYLRDGKVELLYGTQGADGQPQTLAAVLTRLIDYGMDPMAALARPRFLLGKTFSDSHSSLKLEKDVPQEVLDTLAHRGHVLSLVDAHSPLMGHPGVIALNPHTREMRGAHDPRSDGRAMGL
jgi:oxamate amidohydrolase